MRTSSDTWCQGDETMKRHGFSVREFARRFPSGQQRCYVMGKLATDPLYPAVHNVIQSTTAPLLDVGCGMGVLAFYLRQRGWSYPITGVDYDLRKIATACSLAAGFEGSMEFSHGDAGVTLPAHSGSVTVLDILQYFQSNTRDAMLRQCADRIASNGVLVIRTGIMDDTRRFRVTRFMDRMAAMANWMKAPPMLYPTTEELCHVLKTAGLIGEFKPLWGRTPFNNWLGVFRRTNHH